MMFPKKKQKNWWGIPVFPTFSDRPNHMGLDQIQPPCKNGLPRWASWVGNWNGHGYVTHKDCGFTKTTGSITPKVRYSNLARNHSFIDWLLVEPTLLKNMSSSVGITIPNIWKNKIHVPNHQPVDDVPRLADAKWAYWIANFTPKRRWPLRCPQMPWGCPAPAGPCRAATPALLFFRAVEAPLARRQLGKIGSWAILKVYG